MTMSFFNSFEVAIYSDDKVFGLKYYMDPSDFQRIEREVYAEYGMTIKASASRVIEHIPGSKFSEEDGIEFLGGTAVYVQSADGYLPKPRVGKLMTSLTRRLNDEPTLSPVEQYNKVYSIFELLLCVDVEIKKAVCAFLLFVLEQHNIEITSRLRGKRISPDHLYRMVENDLENAHEILGWEHK